MMGGAGGKGTLFAEACNIWVLLHGVQVQQLFIGECYKMLHNVTDFEVFGVFQY